MKKISAFLVFYCLLITNNCFGQNIDSLVIEFQAWRMDSTECKSSRVNYSNLFVSGGKKIDSGYFVGFKKKDIIKILGNPDEKLLWTISYKWNDGKSCNHFEYCEVILYFRSRRVSKIMISISY